jgi:predicted dehydrogenase
MAAQLDNQIELVCGAFSSDPAKSKESGKAYFLPENRTYPSYEEMFKAEAELPEGDRMDFVTIVTPNHMHFPVQKRALESGFNIMSDKPMCFNLSEAEQLVDLVNSTGLLFGLTHNYTGYPMVKEAKHRIASDQLGKIRKIIVEYSQGWLATFLENEHQKQASWRTDPERAGASCCIGDIGTHAENLAEYITGLKIAELCCEFTTFVEGRLLEDDANLLIKYDNGARGILYSSQISVDEENRLSIRVYGEKGGLEWDQQEPNTLVLKHLDRPREIIRAGANYGDRLSPQSFSAGRLPAGHPEGYIEAFAVLYRNFASTLSAKLEGLQPDEASLDFPDVNDGLRGMSFIDACVRSSEAGAQWVSPKFS